MEQPCVVQEKLNLNQKNELKFLKNLHKSKD
jgi:hypothetical protein